MIDIEREARYQYRYQDDEQIEMHRNFNELPKYRPDGYKEAVYSVFDDQLEDDRLVFAVDGLVDGLVHALLVLFASFVLEDPVDVLVEVLVEAVVQQYFLHSVSFVLVAQKRAEFLPLVVVLVLVELMVENQMKTQVTSGSTAGEGVHDSLSFVTFTLTLPQPIKACVLVFESSSLE